MSGFNDNSEQQRLLKTMRWVSSHRVHKRQREYKQAFEAERTAEQCQVDAQAALNHTLEDVTQQRTAFLHGLRSSVATGTLQQYEKQTGIWQGEINEARGNLDDAVQSLASAQQSRTQAEANLRASLIKQEKWILVNDLMKQASIESDY